MPHDSRFGHPDPAVVERYRVLGARIFRTDEHGAITVKTDGRMLQAVPYVGTVAAVPIHVRLPWVDAAMPARTVGAPSHSVP